MGVTGWSGEVSAGTHEIVLTTATGSTHQRVEVVAGGELRLCWDFSAEGPCTR